MNSWLCLSTNKKQLHRCKFSIVLFVLILEFLWFYYFLHSHHTSQCSAAWNSQNNSRFYRTTFECWWISEESAIKVLKSNLRWKITSEKKGKTINIVLSHRWNYIENKIFCLIFTECWTEERKKWNMLNRYRYMSLTCVACVLI